MGQFRRRHFLITSGAFCVPWHAFAQKPEPARVRTIGYLSADAQDPKTPPSEYETNKALRKIGWVEGRNLVIERRFADHKPDRLAGLAQELIRRRVELIIARGSDATIAAARATSTIPIVFIGVPFPVEQGLIDSFAHPTRNLTGAANFTQGTGDKRFEYLREVAPAAKRVYFLVGADAFVTLAGGQTDLLEKTSASARRLGLELGTYVVRELKDLESGLQGALTWGAEAIAVGGIDIVWDARRRIADHAIRHRLPTAFPFIEYVKAGGLLSYGPADAEASAMVERAMSYVDRILRGARPGDLPVEEPRSYELAINLKTAKLIGLKIPQSILLRADRVIE